jgi:hypothetical protein
MGKDISAHSRELGGQFLGLDFALLIAKHNIAAAAAKLQADAAANASGCAGHNCGSTLKVHAVRSSKSGQRFPGVQFQKASQFATRFQPSCFLERERIHQPAGQNRKDRE